ncbi:quinolinate synthase [Flavobacterium nitrogenifigens]|uniref:Quinolinate synthase n=2 Tax=Flavobacterium TaxID=237 RepID=A0A7W7J1P4_9FLAO|nr:MULTISPECIES: quinolinate synthase NadA [Flavobacterium]MBB4804629.1 quinolinate synthase [Flavobacterium nitrogenifigens]MBB6389588.1 quinolinate synthase [Flavobacterium notoginsengisoli]
MDNNFLRQEITRLKAEKNAVILAHYYQNEEIQEIADFIGDSLELSKKAQNTNADVIVFAGVHFMAETAKILNPNKKVLLPDWDAGCSLADGCDPKYFKLFKKQYPNHIVVTYINCSAEIKAMSDLVCTSANAKKIIGSIPETQKIIFAPDENLGNYLKKETKRDLVLWKGSCVVHEAFSLDKLIEIYNKNPKAKIAAHPESESHILKVAHYIGSTSGIINFIKTDPAAVFIVATEAGILHELSKAVPDKTLIPAPSTEDNSCACSECAFMKMNTLEKLYLCLKNESPEMKISEELRIEALKPIERMLELS